MGIRRNTIILSLKNVESINCDVLVCEINSNLVIKIISDFYDIRDKLL